MFTRNKKNIRNHRQNQTLATGIITVLILSGCGKANETIQTAVWTATFTQPVSSPTETLIIEDNPKIQPIKTETPTAEATEEFPSFDYLPENLRDTPQGPIAISTQEPEDNIFIYKNAVATVKANMAGGYSFLNLDNLYDSTAENCDVILGTSGSNDGEMEFIPENGATIYFSNLHGMDYDSCLEHFPFTQMDPVIYKFQTWHVTSGRDYCVITDEGRLSIIRYATSTYSYLDPGHDYPEIVVTTYRQVVQQALTPYPIATETTSKSTDKYAGANLTERQKEGLDQAAQKFIDTVVAGDRKKVASLIDYPLLICRENKILCDSANNAEEFLSVYGELFTPKLVEEFMHANVDEYVGISKLGEIEMTLPDCLFIFYPDGQIYEILTGSIYWELKYQGEATPVIGN